jgi:hypothetical protein
MPKKWSHLEFQVELIYDLLYPGQTDTHLQLIGELDDRSIDSTRTLTSFESGPNQELEERIDLDSDTGCANYLRDHNPTIMTNNAMRTNKPWPRRFDGLKHASLPVTGKYCSIVITTTRMNIMMRRRSPCRGWNGIRNMSNDAWCATSISAKFVKANSMAYACVRPLNS